MRSLSFSFLTIATIGGCAFPTNNIGGDDTSCPDADEIVCYPDQDGDGYGNGHFPDEYPLDECPKGTADNGNDWCDGDASAHTESDCDEHDALDNDGDGYEQPEDCDDDDADINPGADELCNDLDDDCDGVVDNNAVDADIWYYDYDRDGYGDPDRAVESCEVPSSYYTSRDGDCDDQDAATHPDADELCNDLDDDCDGIVDEDCPADLSVEWLVVEGNTLSIVSTVFDTVSTTGTRVLGYGFGGTSDWSYSNGHTATWSFEDTDGDGNQDSGEPQWFTYAFPDGIYRITFMDGDEYALYEGYCVSPTEGVASPLCWANLGGAQGTGYSLCLGVEGGVIYDPSFSVCEGTPHP